MYYVEPHDLAKEFPQFANVLHKLDMRDEAFHKAFIEYTKIDEDIVNAELDNPPMADEFLEELKVRRVHLKDYLYQRLDSAARAND